ncbi:hypothetical protein BGZ96_000472 [Linnemannia gamsii]|uniref:Uncharacterized protein n=1 Tax=Linnemannia gamsii TaxID=64522 RepID=A0ABQ7JQ51_9FUNG|nr:hypothetical protein BGZ96_000472 [Linnemannia gamsii]
MVSPQVVLKLAVPLVDAAFKLLTNSLNETLGYMLKQYGALITQDQCDKNEISYNNSKWRIIVRCTGCIAYEDARQLLAKLIYEVEPHLAVKSIHFEETSILSMLSNDRKLIATVTLGESSMELYECSRSSPNFPKPCVDAEHQFRKTAWNDWKKIIGF